MSTTHGAFADTSDAVLYDSGTETDGLQPEVQSVTTPDPLNSQQSVPNVQHDVPPTQLIHPEERSSIGRQDDCHLGPQARNVPEALFYSG